LGSTVWVRKNFANVRADFVVILGMLHENRRNLLSEWAFGRHVFGNHSFTTIFTEGMQERLAPNDWLKKWTHAEVDAGADIIVMHGAPLLHGVEIYHGRPIFYDLGNFIYNVPPVLTAIDEPMSWESVAAYVQFQGKNLESISFRPIILNYVGEGQPRYS
jgi:Bacterial capsule synthesis protein PGA_cap